MDSMRLLLSGLFVLSTLRAGSVSDFARTVREALSASKSDAEIATVVARIKLDERLEDAVIEQLETEGAGPAAVEAMEIRRDSSAKLPRPSVTSLFEATPVPSEDEQQRIITAARGHAQKYTAALPNFVCTQFVRRFVESKNGEWRERDNLTVDLAYSDKGERYKLREIDGRPTDKALQKVGGFRSNGEFGTLLRVIFEPDSQAAFGWERWSNLRGKRVYVFSYSIDRQHSKYSVGRGLLGVRQRVRAALHGSVYVDQTTHEVVRLTAGTEDLPAGWPFHSTMAVLDYAYADVAGAQYLLPHRIDSRVNGKTANRNLTEFKNYRKFLSEAVMSFEPNY